MITHRLKIWPNHWKRVFDGTKTFEIRNNDRFFQKGDEVVLCPYDPDTKNYLTRTPYCEITRTIGDVYPIDHERVVFSLMKFSRPKG